MSLMHQISFKIDVQIILFHGVFYPLRYIALRTFCFSSRKWWKWNVWSFFGVRWYSGEQTRGRIIVRDFGRCDWLQRNRSYSECFG